MAKEAKNNSPSRGYGKYQSTCHLVVDGVGHLYAPTDENKKAGLPTECVMADADAGRYGKDLKRIGDAKAPERNKMVTDTTEK